MTDKPQPKPEGWLHGYMSVGNGDYVVVKAKLKGKQVQEYEIIHPETSKGDAKRQLQAEVKKHCFKSVD